MNLDEMLKESAPPTLVVDAGQSSILRTEVGKVPGVCTVLGNKATAIRMAWSYNNMYRLFILAKRLSNSVLETSVEDCPPYKEASDLQELIEELEKIDVHVY